MVPEQAGQGTALHEETGGRPRQGEAGRQPLSRSLLSAKHGHGTF